MSKLPKLNLTPEEIDNIIRECLKEDPWTFSDKPISMPKEYSYNCYLCQDTGIVLVYGGPNRPCSCKEKYK